MWVYCRIQNEKKIDKFIGLILKQVTAKKPLNIIATTHKRRLSEGLIIIFLTIAIYLIIALVSYHASDPAWSTSGTSDAIENTGGKIGAYLSDILVYGFGYLCYWVPLLFFLAALRLIKNLDSEHPIRWYHVTLRSLGFVLTLFSSCGLLGLYFSTPHGYIPFRPGGVFADIVSQLLLTVVSLPGATLLLISGFLVGVTIFIGVSWLTIFGIIGKQFLGLCQRIRYRIHCFLDQRNDRHFQKEQQIAEPKNEWLTREPKINENAIERVIPKETVHRKAAVIHPQKPPKQTDLFRYTPSEDLPSLSLLDVPKRAKQQGYTQEKLLELSREIEMRLREFDIEAHVVGVHPGPIITRFELELAPGLKASKITALSKDLARSLSLPSVRVVEIIPGKSVVGLEVPNSTREIVYLREILESQQFAESSTPLSLALGKEISGIPVVVDLTKMPHLLVAGTTGAGKSVSLNAMLLSMLYKATPESLRLILVDPKMLELSVYEGIPHLLTPVVTDMKEAANAFRWCVMEMDRRYQLMAMVGVRNIDSFNKKVNQAIESGNPIPNPLLATESDEGETPILESIPYVVVVVDELSDMMMVVGKKVEELIARIAQKARAAGIHMILATQRPSVDVITGLIKANIPTRIAFQVSSKIDSRTILDQQGAEQLIGNGDMLYLPPGTGLPVRIHGAFVSDSDIHRVAMEWKKRGKPSYVEEILEDTMENGREGSGVDASDGEQDPFYDQAVQLVIESRRPSISYVQRRLKIGYNRAANLLDAMEKAGVVSPMETNGVREVLVAAPAGDD